MNEYETYTQKYSRDENISLAEHMHRINLLHHLSIFHPYLLKPSKTAPKVDLYNSSSKKARIA